MHQSRAKCKFLCWVGHPEALIAFMSCLESLLSPVCTYTALTPSLLSRRLIVRPKNTQKTDAEMAPPYPTPSYPTQILTVLPTLHLGRSTRATPSHWLRRAGFGVLWRPGSMTAPTPRPLCPLSQQARQQSIIHWLGDSLELIFHKTRWGLFT